MKTERATVEQRCPQCWLMKTWPESFVGKRKTVGGGPELTKNCSDCRAKYRGWEKKSLDEKRRLRVVRPGLRKTGELRVSVVLRSANRKLGPIPATVSTSETCPPSCAFFGKGCFAEFHLQRKHWIDAEQTGLDSESFLDWVAALPAGQLWRHNVAGDLPGEGDEIDFVLLAELARAAAHTRGFTFTHKPMTEANAEAVLGVNAQGGLTINLSANSLVDADRLAALDVGPVAAVVPPETRTGDRTPEGKRVVVCPAQTRARLSCADCGLCAERDRKGIVGFYPHGQSSAEVRAISEGRA